VHLYGADRFEFGEAGPRKDLEGGPVAAGDINRDATQVRAPWTTQIHNIKSRGLYHLQLHTLLFPNTLHECNIYIGWPLQMFMSREV
jgi:hypothetical protein